MPARKKPIGFNQKHYDARQIMEMFSVGKTKAYDIIHECRRYGSVIKDAGTVRVSEEALTHWYNERQIESENRAPRRGRPMGGMDGYGIYAVEHI